MTIAAHGRNWKRLILAGLAAGLVMGMVEMMLEAADGAGFWAAPTYIAAAILRSYQDAPLQPAYAFVPVTLGLMGHMMNSLVLGSLFAIAATRATRSRFGLAVLGMAYAMLVFAVLWYWILPSVDPVMRNLNAGYFFLAHLMWGGALGIINGGRPASARRGEQPRAVAAARSGP